MCLGVGIRGHPGGHTRFTLFRLRVTTMVTSRRRAWSKRFPVGP